MSTTTYDTDTETGEIKSSDATPEELIEQLTKCTSDEENIDYTAVEQYIEEIVEKHLTWKVLMAKQIHEQADRRAKPYEESTGFWMNQVQPWVKMLAKHKLFKDGKFKHGKTLHLSTLSFGFTKSGGSTIDEKAAMLWLAQNGNDQQKSCLETKTVVNMDKLKKLLQDGVIDENEARAFVFSMPVDEFAKMSISLPKSS
jgi:hypothetical protein